MDQILSKVWNSRYGKYLLPLSFCVGNLINVMFYYLGLAFQDNIARQTGFVIVMSSLPPRRFWRCCPRCVSVT